MHGAQPQEIAEIILGEPGNQEENEREESPLMFHQVVKTIHILLAHKSADKGHTQLAADPEGQERSKGQADGRQEKPLANPEEVPSNEPGQFARNRGNKNLKNLNSDEDDRGPRAKRGYESTDARLASEETQGFSNPEVEFPIEIKKKTKGNQQAYIEENQFPMSGKE